MGEADTRREDPWTVRPRWGHSRGAIGRRRRPSLVRSCHAFPEIILAVRLRTLARIVLLAVASWAVVAALARVGVVDDLLLALERKSLDYRMARYRGGRLAQGASPSEIVVVGVDEASLAELGRFPLWPRAYHARLVDRLREAGARTVAFDLLFSEPDLLPHEVAEVRAGEIARSTGRDSASLVVDLLGMGGDGDFARALEASGNVIVAMDAGTGAFPVPVLAGAVGRLGHVSMAPDPDGILRRVPGDLVPGGGSGTATEGRAGDALAPLGVAAARAYSGDATATPTEDELLDFLGPRGTFLTFSYADVLAGRVDAALLRDRLVFVGATAAGLDDVFATPFSQDLPGVEAHATLAYQMLNGRRIREAGAPARAGLQLVWALAAAAGATLLGAWGALVGILALAGAHTVVTFEAFAQRGVQLPFAFPLLVLAGTALAAAAVRYGVEDRRRRAIQRAFGRYVATEVVEEIARNPDALRPGGEEREVTVGFVDIRGFTTLTGTLSAPELARFLNAYFTAVEAEVQGRRGMVDKYIGDAVMFVFGAPNHLDDGAARACEAALAIVASLARRADEWARLGVPDLRVGVGVETGPAVVGNLGSERRLEYTVLGDTVNVASRLQDLNKPLGTTIVVGPGTVAAAGHGFVFKDLDRHELRGRSAPVAVHELVAARRAPDLPDTPSRSDANHA